jgi:hypothetical protein
MGSRRANGPGSRLNGRGSSVVQPEGVPGSPATAPTPAAGSSIDGEVGATVALLRRANEALERENARLARAAWSRSGPAAVVHLARAEREWRERAELAEREVARLGRLLATPRHLAVERARERVMRSRLLYRVVRLVWAWTAKG